MPEISCVLEFIYMCCISLYIWGASVFISLCGTHFLSRGCFHLCEVLIFFICPWFFPHLLWDLKKKNNTTGTTSGARTAYPSGTPDIVLYHGDRVDGKSTDTNPISINSFW